MRIYEYQRSTGDCTLSLFVRDGACTVSIDTALVDHTRPVTRKEAAEHLRHWRQLARRGKGTLTRYAA